MNLREMETELNLLKKKVMRLEGWCASKLDPELLKTIEAEDRVKPPSGNPLDNKTD